MKTLTQQEFATIISELPPPACGKRPVRTKTGKGIFDFNLAIAKALRSVELSHALFNVLASIARQQANRGFGTMATAAIDSGVSLNAVQQHLIKSPHLFSTHRRDVREGSAGHFLEIRLSQESIDLLHTVNCRAIRYAKAPSP